MSIDGRIDTALRPVRARRRRGGTAAVAAAIATATGGAVVTTPLFPLYAARWQLSSLVTTSVYAAYIVGSLTALVFFGRLADRIGCRPVLLAGLAAGALGTLALLLAPSVEWLFPGRVLQGLTVGLVSSAGSAALADRTGAPARAAMIATAANVGGMAAGILATGAAAQYLPWPLVLPYLLYLAVLAVVTIAVRRLEEPTGAPRPPEAGSRRDAAGGPEGPPEPDVPVRAFVTAAATTLVGFSSLAVLLALGPTLTLEWTSSTNLALGAVTASLACASAGATQLLARSVAPRPAIVTGLLIILAGLGALLAAGATHSLIVLLPSVLLIGGGYGLVFLGGLGSCQRLVPPGRRATWLSGYFITAYVGMSVPAIGLGSLSDAVGLTTALALFTSYALALSALLITATLRQPTLNGALTTPTPH